MQHHQVGVPAEVARRLEQRGLADAGRAVDHHEVAAALGRLRQRAADRVQLAFAFEEPG